jgi:hypothetical protein
MLPPKRPVSPVEMPGPSPGAHRQPAQHWPHRHRELRQAGAGLLWTGQAAHPVQFPAHRLAQAGCLGRHAGGQGAADDGVETVGIIAVQAHAPQTHHQGIARLGAGDKERPGLRIAIERTRDTLRIDAAGIDGAGLHAVTGPDGQHRCAVRAELVGVIGRRELISARRPGRALRQPARAERMRGARVRFVGIREVGGATHGRPLDFGPIHIAGLVDIDGAELHLVAVTFAGQSVAADLAVQRLAFLRQRQRLIGMVAPAIQRHQPGFGGGRMGGAAQQQQA